MNSNYSLVLATDLDGTFLGGQEEQRREFYQHLEANREKLLLIFVTGRSLDLVQELFAFPDFPQPDYIIGDVGTTVFDGKTLTPVAAVQDWIAAAWDNANEQIKNMLADEPGIELQPVAPQYRVSYHYHPEKLQPSTLEKVVQAGFDCILSADKYMDIMPKGVAKGSTLLKLMATLNLNREDVIPAGDTLNDLSLFATGLKAIAVGNSEPKLVEKIQTMDNVYHSPYQGVAGIWDGIKVYGKSLG